MMIELGGGMVRATMWDWVKCKFVWKILPKSVWSGARHIAGAGTLVCTKSSLAGGEGYDKHQDNHPPMADQGGGGGQQQAAGPEGGNLPPSYGGGGSWYTPEGGYFPASYGGPLGFPGGPRFASGPGPATLAPPGPAFTGPPGDQFVDTGGTPIVVVEIPSGPLPSISSSVREPATIGVFLFPLLVFIFVTIIQRLRRNSKDPILPDGRRASEVHANIARIATDCHHTMLTIQATLEAPPKCQMN